VLRNAIVSIQIRSRYRLLGIEIAGLDITAMVIRNVLLRLRHMVAHSGRGHRSLISDIGIFGDKVGFADNSTKTVEVPVETE
jgi:hypothetical protein